MMFFSIFKNWKVIASLICIGLLVAAFYGCKYYYDSTQERLMQLSEEKAQLVIQNTQNLETIERLLRDASVNRERRDSLEQRLKSATTYQDELMRKLNDHNLTVLSYEKPGLIETRINEATKKLFDDIESTTAE